MSIPISRRRALTLAGAFTLAGGLWRPSLRPARAQESWEDPRVIRSGGATRGRTVRWAAVVENPNPGAALVDLRFDAEVRAGDTIVETDTAYLDCLAPGAHTGLTGIAFLSEGVQAEAVRVRVREWEFRPLSEPGFEDVRFVPGRFSDRVAGLLRNTYPRELTDLSVIAVCYAGEAIIGGGTDYLQRVPAGGAVVLDIGVDVAEPPSRIELYARL